MFGLIIKPASLDLSRGPSVFLHLNSIFFFFSLAQTERSEFQSQLLLMEHPPQRALYLLKVIE